MSLIHPLSQVSMFDYILRYETLITSFCSQSKFSVRSPIKRNIPKITDKEKEEKTLKRVNEEFNLLNEFSITTEEVNEFYEKYFSYNKVKSISGFFNSKELNRDKLNYDYFVKIDIQNFFPSIYTHSLSWAIIGDKYSGKILRKEDTFANATDSICRKINYGETNGIVVGPEFSRIIAEILLSRVDMTLHDELYSKNVYFNQDYKIHRYVDDYYIFANTQEKIELIENILQDILISYNLIQNKSKREIKFKPIQVTNESIPVLKTYLDIFDLKRDTFFLSKLTKIKDLEYSEMIGKKSFWNDLYTSVENLIISNPDYRNSLVKYFLRVVSSKIPSKINISDNSLANIVKEIIELTTNIYILGMDSSNTNYLLQILVKVLNIMNAKENKESPNYLSIEEFIFQKLYSIIVNNENKINDNYDILVFMKMLTMKMPSNLLSRLIENNSTNYFVLCSISKYILNEQNDTVDSGFLTVLNKLVFTINEYFDEYMEKSKDPSLLDGEYFYLLNDFSKYPGFPKTMSRSLERKLETEINQLKIHHNEEELNENYRNLFRIFAKYSYYRWADDTKSFIKKIIKKSSIHINKLESY